MYQLDGLDRYLLAWAAEERCLDVDQVADFVDSSDVMGRCLRHPILPLTIVQQILRHRETLDANICYTVDSEAELPVRFRRLYDDKPSSREEVREFVALRLSRGNGAARLGLGDSRGALEQLGDVIARIGAIQKPPMAPLPHRLASADAAIGEHCLSELDVMAMGGYDDHPILRELSGRDELPAFISAKARNPAVLGVTGNPGDAFSIPVVRHLSNRRVVPRGVWAEPDEPLLFSVGSVIQHVKDRGITWGTGAIAPSTKLPKTRTTSSIYLAVRGPRTRDFVILAAGQIPAVVSDPGLLLPEVLGVPNAEPDVEIGFLPHGVDREDFMSEFPNSFVITNYGGFDLLISGILRCRQIVASSLHGMIFSHALGRPVSLVNVADRLTGGDFKFNDYLASIGTYVTEPRQRVRHLDPSLSYELPRSALQEAQRRLVASFPMGLRSESMETSRGITR